MLPPNMVVVVAIATVDKEVAMVSLISSPLRGERLEQTEQESSSDFSGTTLLLFPPILSRI